MGGLVLIPQNGPAYGLRALTEFVRGHDVSSPSAIPGFIRTGLQGWGVVLDRCIKGERGTWGGSEEGIRPRYAFGPVGTAIKGRLK